MKFDIAHEFASAAYDPHHRFIKSYHVDPQLSTKDAIVYVGSHNVVIAYPGTRLWTKEGISDVESDIRLGGELFDLDWKGDRWTEARIVADNVRSKYGHSKSIELVGHSLGGNLAMVTSAKTGLPATVINPGVVNAEAYQNQDLSNVNVYYSKHDPIAKQVAFIKQSTGIQTHVLAKNSNGFWEHGGIAGYIKTHKSARWAAEGIAIGLGAAATIATGGAFAPFEEIVGEEIVAFETIEPALEETLPKVISGGVGGATVYKKATTVVDTIASGVNGVLNHHSLTRHQPSVKASSNEFAVETQPTLTSGSQLPRLPYTFTAYTPQGYSKVSHEQQLTGYTMAPS